MSLSRLLDQISYLQLLAAEECLGILLKPWFAFHAAGQQHDAAELVGWLRQTLHKGSWEYGKPIPIWEARFEASTED